MNAPEFVYLYGEGDAVPAITLPPIPPVCDVLSPADNDGDEYRCDLNEGHDGPHAAFIVETPVAVWTGEA